MNLYSTGCFPILTVLAAVICSASGFCVGEDASKVLADLNSEFETELETLNKPFISLNEKYREYLEKQRKIYQQAGNLEAIMELDEELKGFETGNSKEPSPFSELKRLQEIYSKQRGSLELKRAGSRLKLIERYKTRAGKLATDWTRADKIDDAKLALAESKRFAEMAKAPDLANLRTAKGVAGTTAERKKDSFAGAQAGDVWENGIEMKLRWIPYGEFTMGSPSDEGGHTTKETQVAVQLTYGFWIGQHEVTQGEYEEITGANPSKFKELGERGPVEAVNYEDTLMFCEKLTQRERRRKTIPKEWSYTLPTEAQWEYACRAGTEGPYSGGAVDDVAWYSGNRGDLPNEVGTKKANPWGLHDMHGNVREWCLDWLGDKLPGGKDPVGPQQGEQRVDRGGGYYATPGGCRSAFRSGSKPSYRGQNKGFRVVLVPTPK